MSPFTSFKAMSLGAAALLGTSTVGGASTTLPPSLTSCTTSESVWTTPQNVSMSICDSTDFKYGGRSLQIVENVCGTRACMGICHDDAKCVRAVYDKKNRICHIKNHNEVSDMIWAVDADFDSITKLVPRGTKPPETPPAAPQQPAKPANQTVVGDAKKGTWSDVIQLPLIPVAAYVVPSFPTPGRLMFFSSWGIDAFGGASGLTQFGSLDLATRQSTHREIANTHHDMFCPGMSMLADGRMLIQGGSDASAVSLYDPSTDGFKREADLKIARGYQSSVTLSNGRVFTIGGAYSGERRGKEGEIYDPATNKWEVLSGADVKPLLTKDHEGIWREDNHAWLFAWRNGSVFQAGPSMTQHWYGTKGYGAVVNAGTRDTQGHAMCGIFVMYDALRGHILSAGGSPDYTDSDANKRAHITTIGDPGSAAAVERVPDMAFERGFANAVVLPDGKVIVTGGMKRSIVFNDAHSVLVAEMFDPATKTWLQLAAAQKPRNYHSVSLLLPDATVFVGGGGLCYVNQIKGSTARCNKAVDHADAEILSPPYLFNPDGSAATRPVIGDLDRTAIRAGDSITFAVTGVDGAAAANYKFSLVRMGSATHSVNTDQRRVPLENFSVAADGKFTVRTPADTGIMIPGHWYLFAISPTGTPSVAKTVQIQLGEAEQKRTAGVWGV